MPGATPMILGDLTFDPGYGTHDLPDKMSWGGAQRLGVHQLPNGVRVIDAMGADDHDLAWSGMFFGPGAVDKARYLDHLRKQGAPVSLSWDVFDYLVVVETFTGDFERFYQVPYKITCKVVQDNTAPTGPSPASSVDNLVQSDMSSVLGTAQNLLGMAVSGGLPGPFSTTLGAVLAGPTQVISSIDGLAPVASALTDLRGAMLGAGSFVNAGAAALAPVFGAVAEASQAIAPALAGVNAILGASPIGGVVTGADASGSAAAFLNVAQAATQAAGLNDMANYVARIGLNLAQGVV